MINSKKCSRIVLYLVLALNIFLLSNSKAQNRPDSTDLQRRISRIVRERLNPQRFWDPPYISIDENGFVSGLAGHGLNISFVASNPIDRAYELLGRFSDLLGMGDPHQELFLEGVPIDSSGHQEHPNITSGGILFEQRVHGVKVRYGGMIVYISRDYDSTYAIDIQTTYQPLARNVDATPLVTEDSAVGIARHEPANGDRRTDGEGHGLLIAKFHGDFHLVWKIGVGGSVHGESAWYYIDAHTGEILKAESAIIR